MSRSARLLELMIRIGRTSHFTAAELATEFGVSRRTILRDLRTLAEMGVPLLAKPGPGGGYEHPKGSRSLSLALRTEEAVGLIIAYESLAGYAASPFAKEHLSAVTKLRAALPTELAAEIDALRGHIAVLEPTRRYDAPLLTELLYASQDLTHLSLDYESSSGISQRLIYPFGIYAARGFWYCACYDYTRQRHLSLRADRIKRLERVPNRARPEPVSLTRWLERRQENERQGELTQVEAHVSAKALRNAELEWLFGPIARNSDGSGHVCSTVPISELDFCATRLLSFGTDVVIASPPELIDLLRQKAAAVANQYTSLSSVV